MRRLKQRARYEALGLVGMTVVEARAIVEMAGGHLRTEGSR
jgi:hypothetical protein